jgi:hypothetical protein
MAKERSKKVDLYTYEEPLFDLIMGRYPKKISEQASDSVGLEYETYLLDDGDEGILYSLFNLNYKTLKNIIQNSKSEYEIRDSKTGEYIEIKSLPKKLGREHLS